MICAEPSVETQETPSPQRFIGTALEFITGKDFSLDPVGECDPRQEQNKNAE